MKVISARQRPHILGEICWCRPRVHECEGNCPADGVVVHNMLMLAMDDQPRMSVFSDQLYGESSSIGFSI